jgi:hypothetical protein
VPVVSDAVQNAWLDLYLRGVGTAPSSLELALFFGDPSDGGTELTSDGGYARATINASDWAAADAGSSVAGPIDFADATDAWSDTATHWCLVDGGDLGPSGALTDPLEVTGPGAVSLTSITVFFADTVVADDSDS